ncbi:DNA-binding MurR/RpiR family transcriptional regulator [Actinoplanes lutulentus]|uniref:RpiR family transcriptional regulator n=1 Tax=Actinoplanes lutulentus TaxID=1287878 RepID=A0A327ZHT7_9ACTN|nr:MurR/RpiR family transcriptional regulator [Actinoplanes lutulentus]MBB2947951.1 DNA-binding MurR/RpiR family transcriptional regulator [Actinoplanes lutulentus]RAK40168.1 RpiR family transcriptional regulator [Actinoplanes lutulentus]
MNDGVVKLVQGARLTPTQRRIAHCLVEHGAKAAYLSAAEVAELAGVSQPSVTRFAMALGYSGYPALRRELRTLTDGEPAEPAGRNAMQRAVAAETDHLRRLGEQLDRLDDVRAAAELLVASRPLPVLGLRAAAPLAAYFGYFAAKAFPDVRVLDGGGTSLLDRLDQARAAGASAMLAIVLPRYPRETVEAVREAKAAGLAVVAITDSAVSPVAESADVVLPAAVGTQLVFDLHTGPMAMAMVLLQAMCDAAPEPVQRRLEQFEATAAQRHIFLA